MKTKYILALMLTFLSFVQVSAQDLPPKHRWMHPIRKADGNVLDDMEKTPGAIKNGKVCDVTGNVIGVNSGHGEETTPSGKRVGKIQKDGNMKTRKGHVV